MAADAIHQQLDLGAVPNHVSNIAPLNTKFHLLEVGWLEADEGFVLRGGNTSLHSTKDIPTVNKRRALPMYCVLIDHPIEGLILWETGCGKDYPTLWGPALSDVFTRVRYEPQHELDAAIEATGHKIEDIKKIIIGHLHLDHAGGLDLFLDRKDIEIWVHVSTSRQRKMHCTAFNARSQCQRTCARPNSLGAASGRARCHCE
jgi:glyoxylase-like metal-dependent hydrolase (beta-lactamase superfamily II)